MKWDELAGPSRLEIMQSAITLLKQWQESTYRLPILENPGAFHMEKERIAKLLVDHHLGKLGRQVRDLAEHTETDSGEFLSDWAELVFVTALWSRFDTLPDGLKLNLIYQSGPNITRKHLSREQPIADIFVVVGVEFSNEELLRRRSVYLYGLSAGQYFVIIDYAFNQQPFDRNYEVGSWQQGTVVRYPFPGSLRISPGDLQTQLPRREWLSKIPVETVPSAVKSFYSLLQVNPFGLPFPAQVELRSDFTGGKWSVMDSAGRTIRMSGMDAGQDLVFYAICFRRPVRFTVVISREGFRPISYSNGEGIFGIGKLYS